MPLLLVAPATRRRRALLALALGAGISAVAALLGAAVASQEAQTVARLCGWTAGPILLVLLAVRDAGTRRSGRRRPSTSPFGAIGSQVTVDLPPMSRVVSEELHRRCVTFNPRVSIIYTRDLSELPAERKAVFWWQQEDFDEFLWVRVELGRAYSMVARRMGVGIAEVSKMGEHYDAGYREMVQIMPELTHESRRGLGLGRKRQRAKSRDAYIAAVLSEQSRQRQAAEARSSRAGGEGAPRQPLQLDAERIAREARRVSQEDGAYAAHAAAQYYEQDRAAELAEAAGVEALARFIVESPMPSASACLNDEEVPDLDLPFERRSSPQTLTAAKGFGLSRDKLAGAGLSATGHAISKFQRLRRLPGTNAAAAVSGDRSDAESAASAEPPLQEEEGLAGHEGGNAESDAEQPEAILQYRSWPWAAPVLAGLPGVSDTKTYGTRRDYRTWRAWGKHDSCCRSDPPPAH